MKKHLFYLIIFIILFAYTFRSLLVNITTNLIDWRDYAYVTWVINQNINHLRSLDFKNLFNLDAFYPFTNTLFLSDTLITQSIIGIPFSFFTKNPVLIFNLIFALTFLFNYIASYLLFHKLFKSSLIAFGGGVSTIFSPFFFTEIGHFQMQNFWPFLLILYLLIKGDSKNHLLKEIFIGILLAIQFLASVYLAFFSLTIIFLFLLIKMFKGSEIKYTVIKLGIIILTFILIDGVFIKGYIDAKRDFGIKRNMAEYLTYSANISDYFFPAQNGIFYQNSLIQKWKRYSKHTFGEPVSFPGFILSSLAILGLIKIGVSKKDFSLHFSSQTIDLFFLVIMSIGFIFSLGYPYLPLVKLIPFFDTIRGVSRWSFLFYMGVVYFSASYLSKIKTKWILSMILILLFADVLPGKLVTYKESYLTKNDEILRSVCNTQKNVILHIPVTHFDAGKDIASGLTYITKTLLAISYNHCRVVNGYSGYDLPSIQKIKDNLIDSNQSTDLEKFASTIKGTGANFISINTEALPIRLYPNLTQTLNMLEKANIIKHLSDRIYLIN